MGCGRRTATLSYLCQFFEVVLELNTSFLVYFHQLLHSPFIRELLCSDPSFCLTVVFAVDKMVSRAPDLHIPASKAIVQVSIIDTTARIDGISTGTFLLPKITGYDYLSCPAFSFIIEHSAGKKVLFDLGVRKDWENFSPSLYERITSYGWQIVVQKDVRDILEEENIDLRSVHAIIWRFVHTLLQLAKANGRF